jgi:hypothetical protein
MKTILNWLKEHRKTIGYGVGILCILSGVSYYLNGQHALSLLWVVIGSFIIWDNRENR